MQRTPERTKQSLHSSDPNNAAIKDKGLTLENWISHRQKKKRMEDDIDCHSCQSQEDMSEIKSKKHLAATQTQLMTT